MGVLRKVPYRDPGSRLRHEYELTEAGEELLPVMLGLFSWGSKHLDSPGAASISTRPSRTSKPSGRLMGGVR
ncbi:winged helix-turn-helix transcriptional regulator [Streptosporangium canum]|uniref:winged helix-turn-helix transcriptional regulator n=1 Tax=Streptosporangium canum TaxID=324952 RepID=UPI003447DEDC